ncbi:MAG: ADP-glyceromanno-heptose 6-epimerase, partial [Bacteroidota bacterium]
LIIAPGIANFVLGWGEAARRYSKNHEQMIVLTGAAGFIGSATVAALNAAGYRALALVDDFSRKDEHANFAGKRFWELVDRNQFFNWLTHKQDRIECIIHLGARTDTTETDTALFDRLNLDYSKRVFEYATRWQIPLIYASSAATYGGGEHGFDDDHARVSQLQPLNAYGQSKQDFDTWVLAQTEQPFFWAGLKFFNVYGPNEYHKGRMASVVFHAFNQIQRTGELKLFQSHHPDYADGEQARDFIYVKDVTSAILHLMERRPHPGIFNLGSGKARTFKALGEAVFAALQQPTKIEFIPTPQDIRANYQYFTQANMKKLNLAGWEGPHYSLEDGVNDYVNNYLLSGNNL